jgi:hypothetical protein
MLGRSILGLVQIDANISGLTRYDSKYGFYRLHPRCQSDITLQVLRWMAQTKDQI